jgi:hypothetical protein
MPIAGTISSNNIGGAIPPRTKAYRGSGANNIKKIVNVIFWRLNEMNSLNTSKIIFCLAHR